MPHPSQASSQLTQLGNYINAANPSALPKPVIVIHDLSKTGNACKERKKATKLGPSCCWLFLPLLSRSVGDEHRSPIFGRAERVGFGSRFLLFSFISHAHSYLITQVLSIYYPAHTTTATAATTTCKYVQLESPSLPSHPIASCCAASFDN
jgi:hypothetical protein